MNGSADGTGRSERLESWKEIAAYLGRGVTTVQRWEQHEGLPVHRLPHAKKGSVFAIRSELDDWRRAREQPGALRETAPGTRVVPQDPRRPIRLDQRVGITLVVLLLVTVTWLATSRVIRRTSGGSIAPAESSVIPRPLANDVASEECPSLTPDGTRVVYYWNRADDPGLYVKAVDGSPRRLPTSDAGNLSWCGHAKWSPSGDLIAFLTRGEGDTRNVWVMPPSGGRPRLLTSASGIDIAWTPDGQTLAFVDRNSPGEPFSIFSIPVRGGQRRRLTTPPLGTFGDTHCAFSPDGRRLAVVRYLNRYQSDLFVMRLDQADNIERLTTGSAGMTGIDWSPDDRAIVFGSHQGLWKVPLAGARKPTPVAAVTGAAYFPTFSRRAGSGSPIRLVYQSDLADANIWRWEPRRGEATKIAGSTWYEDFPAVAPSGDLIAFASNRTGQNEIWVVQADGSNPQQVTFHRGPVVTSPAWSPDGERLAFSSEVGGNRDIYVIRPDGSQSTRITTAPSEETNPSWSPDGRWIYFRSDEAGIGQLWKVPADGGRPVRVTVGEALRGFSSPDGRSLYFVRSVDAPGLWSVPVDGGRETLVLSDVRDGYWAVADSGVFYIVPWTEGSTAPDALRFFAFATRTVSILPAPPGEWGHLVPGFSAARDGRFVLWTRFDNKMRDLMLIEPWVP